MRPGAAWLGKGSLLCPRGPFLYHVRTMSSISSQAVGQFDGAEPPPALATGSSSPSPEWSEGSGDECWDLEFEDWHLESGDFTKKLNAVRSGHLGANTQQKGDCGRSRNISQKAIQVTYILGGIQEF